jgi:hypothetical protein
MTKLLMVTVAVAATTMAHATPSSLWNHNGSLMGLVANGPYRQFVYEPPRSGMIQVGVRPGTLLFDGRKDGYQYTGTAYVFPPNCPPVGYYVSGPLLLMTFR